MRRWIRRAARVGLAMVALVLATTAVVVWRVRSAPVSLAFLVPRFEAALRADEGWQVHLDGLDLAWQADGHRAELRARGLAIARPADGAAFRLEAARVRLNRAALLRGQVVVVGVEVDAPDIRLRRAPGGELALELGTPSAGARDAGWVVSAIRRLEHVAVRGGRIAVVDEATATSWALPHVDADAWRGRDGGWRLQLALGLASGDATIPLWVDASHEPSTGAFDVQISSPGADTAVAFAAWPAALAPHAHEWVTTHVKDGRIAGAVLAASGRIVDDHGSRIVLDTLDADVDFDGLSVRWLDTMPPVTGVGGSARFGRERVAVAVERGGLDRLQVGPASVYVGWPPGVPARLAVDARVRGPLVALVDVLDHEPVALGERVSVRTRGMEGASATRVRVAFPLEPKPVFGKLGLRARTTLTGATVPGLAGDWDVTDGNVEVALGERALAIDGTATVRGVPATIRYRDRLGRGNARRLDVAARLDGPAREALGLEAGTWLDGPIDARLRLAPRKDGRIAADLDADFGPARIDVPALALAKEPGAPGRLAAQAEITRGVASAIRHFEASAGAVTLRGSAERAAGGGAWSRVDATAAFALPDRADAALVELTLGAEDRAWRFSGSSRDAAGVLRAYGYDHARGGRLGLDGMIVAADADGTTSVTLTVEDVTLVRVPWLVKVVSLASVRGLLDLGSQQTIAIDRAVVTIAATSAKQLEIRDGVARGPQVGLTLAGSVDRDSGELDLRGTLIPSYYFLNEGAERIPIIGGVIGMATAGAVQGVDFTVTGSRADPVVAVQPISSLAPGVLREWLRKLGL